MKNVITNLLVLVLCITVCGDVFAQLNITYTTTDNTICSPEPNCPCHGKLTSITLLYHGPSSVTINVYKKHNFTNQNLITTLNNVQDEQILTVNGPGGGQFDPHTFFWIVGTPVASAQKIHTSCSQVNLGATYGNFTVIGYADKDGRVCNVPLCTGSIDLTVTGGTPPYTYKWSNGGTAQDQHNLCPGTYHVVVKGPGVHSVSLKITISDAPFVCDDNNLCTTDRCYKGECRSKQIKCDDHDKCTSDACVDGVCIFTPLCDDNNSCTIDYCHRERADDDDDDDGDDDDGNGRHQDYIIVCYANPVNCDDEDLCTDDQCIDGSCVHTPANCDDGDNCTKDACENDQCANTPIPDCGTPCVNVNCDDGNACTIDACNNGICSNTPMVCDDDDGCTFDECVSGSCTFLPIDCGDDDPCTEDACIEDECSNTPLDCDDNDACTNDQCVGGECFSGLRDCYDNDPCTNDNCSNGQCVNTPIVPCGNPCANSTLTADATGTNPDPCDVACNGSATVNATGGTPPYNYSWSNGATTQTIGAPNTATTIKCINAGGPEYSATNGDVFLADQDFTPGSPGTAVYPPSPSSIDILNTTDDVMYRTERNAVPAPNGNGTMAYSIAVTNGQYDVELHFAEIFYGVTGGQTSPPPNAPATWPVGMRKFDVAIEGVQVLNDYDINGDVGPATAVVKTFTTTVTDGFVTIDFTNVTNRAKVNGICVKPHDTGTGLCSGTYTASVTDASGCVATDAVALCKADPCGNLNCDDDDPCTLDGCTDGLCSHSPVIEANASGNNPDPCSECNGLATANPIGGLPPYSYSWSTGETTQTIGAQSGGTEKCINAGGPEFTASNGDVFLLDQDYNPGSPGTVIYPNNTVADIAGTIDDVLYRTERNAAPAPAGNGAMSYNIPVPNGQYNVELHFAEIFYGVAGGQTSPPAGAPASWPVGMRIFDVSIEGVLVLDNYDINADVGPATAVIKTFGTNVADGSLDIEFTSVENRAKISGICVKPVTSNGGLCAGTYNVTVTDAKGCSASGVVNLCNGGLKLSGDEIENSGSQIFANGIDKLSVYPVPFEDMLNVEFTSGFTGEADVALIDVLGQVVIKERVGVVAGNNYHALRLDGTLASGIYFLELRLKNEVKYVKLLK